MDTPADRFSSHLRQALVAAQQLAQRLGHAEVMPLHLLTAIAEQTGALAAEILRKGPLETTTLHAALIQQPKDGEQPSGQLEPALSESARQALAGAIQVAYRHHHPYVGTEHLLASLLEHGDEAIAAALTRAQVNHQQLSSQVKVVLRGTSRFTDLTSTDEAELADRAVRAVREGRPDDAEDADVLGRFTIDLTERGERDELDPVIGREVEIERLIHILCRRTKNNPVLLGEAGVGKTAIVEGLARRLARGEVPAVLAGKRIVALDLGALVAGTMYRGEFEQRLKRLVDELSRRTDVIVFIDELHSIVGAGSATGTMDAANLLKPALARGQLRCIGATTEQEYKRHIETDPALERRFQPIRVPEATPEEALAILGGIRERYEQFHHVRLGDDALDAAVKLSHRYLSGRFLPDKAIDLLDEAAAQLKVSRTKGGGLKRLRLLERQLAEVSRRKAEAIIGERYDEALRLREEERTVATQVEESRSRQERRTQRPLGTVSGADVAALVARTVGVPTEELLADDRRRLLDLEQRLAKHIVGQDEALGAIAESVRRQRAGLASPNRPIGSFMFLGPSGVGKTATAKALAAEVFDDPRALIRIDMGEFSQEFQASKLIGAPAGYVGYRDQTTLADAVRRKPYSVVLFDEVEKAHPEIFNLLLPVLDEGFLTDASGVRVDFRHTIIILTANVGLAEFTRSAALGFSQGGEAGQTYERLRDQVLESLNDYFRPEFLNRLDRTVVFRPFSREAAAEVAKLEVAALASRLAEREVTLVVDEGLYPQLAEAGFSPEEGARGIRRAVEEQLEHPLAHGLLAEKFKPGDTVRATLEGTTAKLQRLAKRRGKVPSTATVPT